LNFTRRKEEEENSKTKTRMKEIQEFHRGSEEKEMKEKE
jgi:hypothetical protein